MTNDLWIGLAVTAVPALVVGYLMLNRQPPILRMYLALLLIGLGYLVATGAIEDIGAKFARTSGLATVQHIKAADPAPDANAAAPAETPKAPASTQVDPYPGAPKPAQ